MSKERAMILEFFTVMNMTVGKKILFKKRVKSPDHLSLVHQNLRLITVWSEETKGSFLKL